MPLLIPKPDVTRAMLVRDGVRARSLADFTPHRYVKTEECTIRDGGGTKSPAWEHVFECEVTGRRRRWGIEHRRVHVDAEVLA